jgi:DNA repair protein RadA/Sms
VLEKHAGLKLNSFDVFLNVSGGFNISDTSADLAVAIAITSSLKDQPVDHTTGFAGEISLSGDIRPVTQCARRLIEFKVAGFKRAVVSYSDLKEASKSGFGGDIIGVKTIQEAISMVFPR